MNGWQDFLTVLVMFFLLFVIGFIILDILRFRSFKKNVAKLMGRKLTEDEEYLCSMYYDSKVPPSRVAMSFQGYK